MYTFNALTSTRRGSSSSSNPSSPSMTPSSPKMGPSAEFANSILSKPFTVVLVANVMQTSLDIHERYDFKGSTVGRQTRMFNFCLYEKLAFPFVI
jgi:hypothetical protein